MNKKEWTLPIGLAYCTLPSVALWLLIWWLLN